MADKPAQVHSSVADSQKAGQGLVPSAPEDVPGKATPFTTRVTEGAASALQSFKPLSNFTQHICTWAMYSQDPSRKIQTHHFASRLSDEVVQCIVFDSPEQNARIIGIEYIISESLFNLLPDEEKKLWHSHAYEISEGLWLNPGVPESMQQAESKQLIKTFGKFWNTWQFDRGDKLPLGPPALMVSPQDHPNGRIPEEMIAARDKQMNTNTAEKRESRAAWQEAVKAQKKKEKEEEKEASAAAKCADWWAKSGEGWMTLIKPVPLNLEAVGEGSIRSLGKEGAGAEAA